MTAIQRQLMTDQDWLRSIGCEAIRGRPDEHGADFPQPRLRMILRAATADRLARRQAAQRSGLKTILSEAF